MTHGSEEHGNTANVDEKYTRNTHMQFMCQNLTALNIFENGLHNKNKEILTERLREFK